MRPFALPMFLTLTSPILLLLSACQPGAEEMPEALPPWVLTVPLEVSSAATWSLTGAVQARHEIPLSFRIGGEILERRIDAGDRVAAGQLLFRLDPRDVIQQRIAAEAAEASARAETENAERERDRLADLLKKRLASQQDFERAATAARAASERLRAAQATLAQALNALGYASLTAPAAGVVLEANGQVGQVVTAGQTLAMLAEDGPREVEVHVPEDRRDRLPTQAIAEPFGTGLALTATLREIAGTADPVARTWRARYRLSETPSALALGTTVTLRFESGPDSGPSALRVPLGAILERAEGPLVWRLADGHVQPEPVTLLGLDGEYARIQTALAPGTPVVALGVNRLQPGQAVRVRQP
ncbi:efflux RND transporter periplasmic adaptor subunit [uncultured Thiocystis sp.]|uniref:efflux RND transporter periplasmic adaptor subunit n=1 Tax=uncultured Thiocystis sp. TaxID=1202134 RepID=UPI0025E0592C|nr:efflux RND transporter periplasmic adaptor subunit [uncultured Thiocystis sp.]